jgi:MoxR-like ATPase
MVKALGDILGLTVKRVQFTPDLLPLDIIGTEIYVPHSAEFKLKKGPIFTQILVADEINRAPAKVQAALLEAMQERAVTIGDGTFKLAEPFLVLATQNPIEQEGTYNLPEAQMDRFIFKVKVDYGTLGDEIEMMRRAHETIELRKIMDAQDLLSIKALVSTIKIADPLMDYIARLVTATRNPVGCLAGLIEIGASPRASLAFDKVVRVQALMEGRSYGVPQDVKDVAHDILRHRIRLSYDGEASGWTMDRVIDELLKSVAIP